jgi:hypothetical protein
MQDPGITLMACIKDGWTLGGALAKANIKFSTGWYDEDFLSPQISVTEMSDLDIPFELGYGTIKVDAIYQIDIWVKILKVTGNGPGIARGYLWDMREEVKSILRSNLTGLTDLRYVELNQTGRRMDEPERQLLRFNKLVLVIYEI